LRISPAYLDEQRRLHGQPRGYGGRGSKWAETILALVGPPAVDSVLDYGAGQGSLGRALRHAGLQCADYDPAVDSFRSLPELGPFDLVTCTDVLEHVETEYLDAVLSDLAILAPLAFIVIGLVPTDKTLSDGRQAHITLRPRAWWIDRLALAGLELREEIVNRPEKQFVGIFQRKA
jgi:hypothetical protein